LVVGLVLLHEVRPRLGLDLRAVALINVDEA
jgi:hypothetical protein